MKIINFNVKEFESLKDSIWMLGNNILYKLCSDFPKHTNPEEICAKIWLIGRAYAASIERRKNKKEINDKFYANFIEAFIKFNNTEEFDKQLNSLKNKEFDEKTLKKILELHFKLTEFFNNQTKLKKRSLASKYLHFHIPIFPIYDSRANNSLRFIVKGKPSESLGDKEYSIFCNKILFLYKYIKNQTGKPPTLREIDTFLVKVKNNKLSKKIGE